MASKIIGSDIFLTRGDTLNIAIPIMVISNNKQPYEFLRTDTLYFTVKDDTTDENFVFQKVLTISNVGIDPKDGKKKVFCKILPSDTESLEYKPYSYDVELKMSDTDVYTIIGPAKFEVTDEVTFKSNEVMR